MFKKILKSIRFNVIYWFLPHPRIMSFKKTIDYILKNNCSFARFGDGELNYMSGKEMYFEDKSETKKERLITAFKTKNKKVLICLTSSINFNPFRFTRKVNIYYHNFYYKNYWNFYPIISKYYLYGDALITRFYLDFRNKKLKVINNKVLTLKKLWDNRHVIIVEGQTSKLGVGNDLFNNTLSIRRIICPSKGCMDLENNISKSIIKNYHKNDLVIMALGPTASILCSKLPISHNIQCFDLGHIDVEYIWFINKAAEKKKILGKNVVEALDEDCIIVNENIDLYKSQIIDYITFD